MKNGFRRYFIPGFTALLFTLLFGLSSCQQNNSVPDHTRGLVDTVGFAHTPLQMSKIIQRVNKKYGQQQQSVFRFLRLNDNTSFPLAIAPHDDYTYAADVYNYIMPFMRAPVLILIGVAHRAKQFNAQDKIVFGSFKYWTGPYGPVPVSSLREQIISRLPEDAYTVNDSLQAAEHSLEAFIPFLQYYHRKVQIVPILVPYMRFEDMSRIAGALSKAIGAATDSLGLKWGPDFAMLISTDCVHYGDRNWGGRNFAFYGSDSAGYRQALRHEMDIIENSLAFSLDSARVHQFYRYTLQENDYKKYKWTWCGRYSVPFGLLTAYFLSLQKPRQELMGTPLKYSTSIEHAPIPVKDLKMGVTAPANLHHWVGYVAMAYTLIVHNH